MATWPVRGGLLVVGVGRSGTSVATRLAVNLGLRPPPDDDLLAANEFNPDGYWESRALAELNDGLLDRWSSTWWTPPPEVTPGMVADLDDAAAPAAAVFADVFGAASGWVWKDPRLTVLLPFWAPDPSSVPVLVPFRDPTAVATSVTARDALTLEQSLLVWERHTRLLLAALAGRPVLLAEHRELLADANAWSDRLGNFGRHTGLPIRRPAVPPTQLVTARPTGPPAVEPTDAQRVLLDLCREHAGHHETFPVLALPAPTPGLDDVTLPAWYTARRG
jgi:hypothetical protein